MISKNHRQNHNFQIKYFLAGSCFTADAAYFLLQDLKEERQSAIEHYHVSKIREKAKMLQIKILQESESEVDRINAEADLLELENNKKTGEILYQAALDELNYINDCLSKINKFRKYKHLSDSEACQAMQQEEWKYELIHRAENSLLTTGTISPDQFVTMRMHPEFKSEIFPAIQQIQEGMQSGKQIEFTNPVIKLLE